MKAISKKLLSVTLSVAMTLGMAVVPAHAAEGADGIYEGFSGLPSGQQSFSYNTTTWSLYSQIGNISVATWSDASKLTTEIVDGSTIDEKKSGAVLKNDFTPSQGMGYTAEVNTKLKKGDIFTISFEYYERTHKTQWFNMLLNAGYSSGYEIVPSGGTKYDYRSITHSDEKNGADKLFRYRECFYPFDAACGYSIGVQKDGFARYDIVLNTCDNSENGEQTVTFYRDGELLEKGIFYESGKKTPLTEITKIAWYVENTTQESTITTALDNIYLQKTSIADGKKTGIFAKLDGSGKTVNYASGGASASASGKTINFSTGGSGEYAVSYRSIARDDGSGTMNIRSIADSAYLLADVSLPNGANPADYYVVLASKPEADNGNRASASGVSLAKYYKSGERVKIPLSAFSSKQFPNGNAAYSELDDLLIAGAGIAYAPGTAGTGSVDLGDIYIACDIKGPTDFKVSDISSGEVTLGWTPSENTVFGYELYRDGTKIADISADKDSYVDSGLALNQSYSYILKTKTLFGEYLPELAIDDVYVSVVGKPTNFEAENIGGEELAVRLDWSAPEYGTAENYVIYRGGSQIAEVDASTFTYTDSSGLSDNTEYKYVIYAKAADGTLSAACYASVAAAYVYAPQNVAYSGGKLKWNAAANAESYEIYINGEKIADTKVTEYSPEENLVYSDIYSFAVIAVTAGGKKSKPSDTVCTYLIDPMINEKTVFYREKLESSVSVKGINASADTESTENTLVGAKAIKAELGNAMPAYLTVASSKTIGADKLIDSGRIVFSAYVPENADLSRLSAGLAYTPSGANVTPVVAAVPLADYLKAAGRWTIVEIPISKLPKEAVYKSNGQEHTVDVEFNKVTGITLIGDFTGSETGAEIYLDKIFVGNYSSQSAKLLDNDENTLSDSNKLPTNSEFLYLSHPAGFDAASLKSGAVTLTAEDGTKILTSYTAEASGKIKVNILSALAANTNYTLNISGLKDKNGSDVSGSLQFSTNSDAAESKGAAKADALSISANGTTVGGAVNAKISVADPCLSELNASDSEITVTFDDKILGVDAKNVKSDGSQVKVSGNKIVIKNSALAIGNDAVTIAFSAVKAGNGKITVSGKFTNGTDTRIILNEASTSVQISESQSSSGHSGSYGGGRDTSSVKETPQPTSDTPAGSTEFTDVSSDYWAYKYISKMAKDKIVSGYPDGSFLPEGSVRREEFAVMLSNAFEISGADGDGFSDIDNSAWYANAVLSAQKLGIISGRGDGSFGLGETMTREDMCVMIKKTADMLKLRLNDNYDRIIFADRGEISDYALEAVEALQKSGIVAGYSDGTFKPKDKVTRAAAVKVIASLLSEADGVQQKPTAEPAASEKPQKSSLQVSQSAYDKAQKKLKAMKLSIPQNGMTPEAYLRLLAGAFGENITEEQAPNWAASKGISYAKGSEISYGAALSAAVEAMQLSVAAESYGGGEEGAYRIASEYKLTKNISIGLKENMKAETACVLISNLLDANATESTYGDSSTSLSRSDETVMEKYLNIRKIRVSVIDISKSQRKIVVSANGAQTEYSTTKDFDFDSIAPVDCTIYVDEDGLVCYCDMNGDVEIFYDYIKEINGDSSNTGYYTESIKNLLFANRDKECKLSDRAVIYYNDEKTDASKAYSLHDCFARVVMLDNKLIYADVYNMYEGGLIYAVDSDYIKYTKGNINQNAMRGISDVDNITVILDGTRSGGIELLDEGMIFDYWVDDIEDTMLIAASSRKASGKLGSVSSDEIVIDGIEYKKSGKIRFYDTYMGNYTTDNAYTSYSGEYVDAYIDDLSEVRYVRPNEDSAVKKTVYGVVTKVFETEEGSEKYSISMIPIYGAGSGNEQLTYAVKEKLPKKSLSPEYAKSVQKNLDGKGFLKFTINGNDEISNIEFVENMQTTVTLNSPDRKMDEETYFFSGLCLKYANMFCIYEGEDGFTVKTFDYEYLRKMWFTSYDKDVFLTVDYNAKKNPLPKFGMVTGNVNKVFSSSEIYYTFINDVTELEDDYSVVIGATSYNMSKKYVENEANHIKKGMLINGRIHPFAPNPISVTKYVDLSGGVDTWKAALEAEYGKYTNDPNRLQEGMYCADKILLRSTEYAQFEIDGKTSDVMGLSNAFAIYEIDETGKTKNVVTAPVGIASPQWFQVKQAMDNIVIGDRVWFSIENKDGTFYINRMYYCKNDSLKPKD